MKMWNSIQQLHFHIFRLEPLLVTADTALYMHCIRYHGIRSVKGFFHYFAKGTICLKKEEGVWKIVHINVNPVSDKEQEEFDRTYNA